MTQEAAPSTERIEVKGEHLVAKVINDADGNAVLEMPMTVGVIGLLSAPKLTAVGTLGALASHYSIDVERQPDTSGEE